MIVKQIASKIYALIGETSDEVANVMIRIQENYESPKFRNKVFTMEEFIPWYMKSRNKDTFTYFDDWAGFNVPGHVVMRFYHGKFDPLRPEEQWLLEQLSNLNIKGKFYLLGYAAGDMRVKKHEIAHGMFYTNKRYKEEVLLALSPFDTVNGPLVQYLRDYGYHKDVVVDEFHAWTLTDGPFLKKLGLWTEELDKLRDLLESIYQRHEEEM